MRKRSRTIFIISAGALLAFALANEHKPNLKIAIAHSEESSPSRNIEAIVDIGIIAITILVSSGNKLVQR